jgi:hypothetical protein
MSQLMQFGLFFAAVAAIAVCGCIFMRKPTKKLPVDSLRADERQLAASLSKKKGAAIGRAAACRSSKKLGRAFDQVAHARRDEDIAKIAGASAEAVTRVPPNTSLA